MSFFTRLSNGWQISMNSLQVLKENKQLILFPIISGISMVLVMGSFLLAMLGTSSWNFDLIESHSDLYFIGFTLLFYLVNYFVVVFFNVALTHCTRMYFHGEEVNLKKGIDYSMSRIGAIFSWTLFAATVGTILRYLQENTGWLGRIIIGALGLVWSVTTFFVVPVIAYENLGPLGAFKRSAGLMKQKWGESAGATFSFGLIQFLATILVAVPLLLLGMAIHPVVGIGLGLLALLLIMAVFSAAKTIFVSAIYHNINGDPVQHFNDQFVENLFVQK
ncbi:DUF6159 family protein [Paraflavitalea sp. CAU 1676]|uniref:DUF6159 family protein n=1 Tax=Paraflavitalea sp. CAU 1676 TaxID=3032598 RepID=UPI0023DA19FC|nr:DUF6159 family protein [Paraflavitalea sp. CAU 1676]MDF2191182.1 DUF6159 family protein [Paraflavitalea sp. CAU 1676]